MTTKIENLSVIYRKPNEIALSFVSSFDSYMGSEETHHTRVYSVRDSKLYLSQETTYSLDSEWDGNFDVSNWFIGPMDGSFEDLVLKDLREDFPSSWPSDLCYIPMLNKSTRKENVVEKIEKADITGIISREDYLRIVEEFKRRAGYKSVVHGFGVHRKPCGEVTAVTSVTDRTGYQKNIKTVSTTAGVRFLEYEASASRPAVSAEDFFHEVLGLARVGLFVCGFRSSHDGVATGVFESAVACTSCNVLGVELSPAKDRVITD